MKFRGKGFNMRTLFGKLILGMMVVGFLSGCAGLGSRTELSNAEFWGKTSEIPL